MATSKSRGTSKKGAQAGGNKSGGARGAGKGQASAGGAGKATKQRAMKAGAQKASARKGGAREGGAQNAGGGGGGRRNEGSQSSEQPQSPMPAQHQEKPGLESQLTPRPEFEAPRYKGSGKLQDKAALITGGDSGIGRAVSVLYAREGADVAIVYLPEEQSDAEETRGAVEAEGRRALLIPGDVRDPEFCRAAVEQTVGEFGKLDILVNNAAFQQHQKSLEDVTEEQWDRTFKTNIYGYFHMAKAALPHLREGSAIVNCGSITGLQGSKELLDYSATKGAIHAFTKSLAQNLVERKIRVNCVAPGPVWTPLNPSDKDAEEIPEFGADTPLKRPAQPEEIAPAFVFFASEADSSYVTGEIITLLGGETTAG